MRSLEQEVAESPQPGREVPPLDSPPGPRGPSGEHVRRARVWTHPRRAANGREEVWRSGPRVGAGLGGGGQPGGRCPRGALLRQRGPAPPARRGGSHCYCDRGAPWPGGPGHEWRRRGGGGARFARPPPGPCCARPAWRGGPSRPASRPSRTSAPPAPPSPTASLPSSPPRHGAPSVSPGPAPRLPPGPAHSCLLGQSTAGARLAKRVTPLRGCHAGEAGPAAL